MARGGQRSTAAAVNEIAVFAKAPIVGQVKTRLIPALGAQAAADLQARLIEATLAKARALPATRVCLWLTGGKYAAPPGVALARQQGPDLGARMAHAFAVTLARARACVLIGTDCPALTTQHLRRAFECLHRHDVVVQPAVDGGYVLIGLKAPQPRLFEGIPWGTATVMSATRAAIEACDLNACYLDTLPDLDTPQDLARARAAGWI